MSASIVVAGIGLILWLVIALVGLALFALAALSTAAGSPPVAVVTVLAPDWSNPGAWLTNFALVSGAGQVYSTYKTGSFYSAIAASASAKEFYATTCSSKPCVLDIRDLATFDTKSKIPLNDTIILNMRYYPAGNVLVGLTYSISEQTYVAKSFNPSTMEVTELFTVSSVANAYPPFDSRSALDLEGGNFYYLARPDSSNVCYLYSYSFSTDSGSRIPFACSDLYGCSTSYVANLQFVPSTKSLYFVPGGSDLFCSIDPSTGATQQLLNISTVVGIRAQGQYYGSFVDSTGSQYWVQVMTPLLPLKVFWAQISINSGAVTLKKGMDGPEIYEAAVIA